MVDKVNVWYQGWGERWHWGTLASSTLLGGRPQILFEFSTEAQNRGLELSSLLLPLKGPRLRRDFPQHQLGLPGPVYDALPDGWGMLLMDRLFRLRGLNAARIGPLERLTWIGANAMGAMTFSPVHADAEPAAEDIALEQLAEEVEQVQQGDGAAFLQRLLQMGGSPQGARPKALLWRNPLDETFSTAESTGREAWLVKFPAREEHPEVCAIEAVYAQCLRDCGIATPDTGYYVLPNGQAAFASRRFDRLPGQRVPMQSLAAYTGADYRQPGALDYGTFLRATRLCTNDARQVELAFERAVFNVVFNNRDDHPKNFAWTMDSEGHWRLAPAYDVTFCEGPGGYHQMDVSGEALDISRRQLVALGEQEADLSSAQASEIIDKVCHVASRFRRVADEQFQDEISTATLGTIANRIAENSRGVQSK